MLNRTETERKKEAAKDYAAKLALELTLYKAIRPIFNNLTKSFVTTYTTTGLIPSMVGFRDKMEKTLKSHYVNVSDIFSKRIIDKLGEPTDYENILNSIKNRIQLDANKRAAQSTSIIQDTSMGDMHDAITKVTTEAGKTGKILSDKEIAEKAKFEINKQNLARLGTISATETQNPAETAKQTEFTFLNHHNAEINGKKMKDTVKKKQWVAILDNFTREWHAEADGQIVDFDEPFIVNGQQLMTPGDMSLGATIDNIINCRCSSVPIIEAEESEEDEED